MRMADEKKPDNSWLVRLIEPILPTFHEVLAISLFVNIIALAAPIFTMQVYDRVVSHNGISTLQGLVLGMIIMIVFDYVLRQTRGRVLQTVALRIDVLIGRRLYDKMMSLPLRTLESQPAAYWQTVFRDVDNVRNTLSGPSALLMADLPFALLFLAIVFIVAKPIAWVLLISLALFLVLAWRSSKVMGESGETEKKAVASRDTVIAETIAARTAIKALSLDRSLRPVWEEALANTIHQSILRGGRSDGFVNIGSLVTVLTSIAMVSVGAVAIMNQELTMGGMVAANMLSGRLLGPLNQLVSTWRSVTAFRQSVQRLGTVFGYPSDNTESKIALDRPKGQITVEDASFVYAEGGKPVVEGVRLAIPPGGLTAIVGRNGCGKTTLMKIILGLYRPAEGRVLLDGADIAQFTRVELSGWIGYVPQDNILFTGTIRENIEHGAPGCDDEQIVRAAHLSGVHSFIVDFADGYGTHVGESGNRLSGGMRQRVALARALVGNPPVLVLDEPSASLDRQAEDDLRAALVAIAKDHTVIMATHSPALLAACRTIVVMDRGKIVAAGPAAEILPKLFGQRPQGQQKPPPAAPAEAASPAPAPAPAKSPETVA